MRKRLLRLLKCPNGGSGEMILFAFNASAGDRELSNSYGKDFDDDFDVKSGVLFCEESQSAYIIKDSIAVLLADEDIDLAYISAKLETFKTIAPYEVVRVIDAHRQRIAKRAISNQGKWNSEEMEFYDRAVADNDRRQAMLKEIWEKPIWRNFIPRQKFIVNSIREFCLDGTVLEIGSGNSRTIANIFRPKVNGYCYVGSDISFNRLLVAKMAIPEGDFIQASAVNLPFIDNAFEAIISFGMLHHLPEPLAAISGCAARTKNGGYFCFHEPIIKPKLLGGQKTALGRMFATYEHSEHDNDLDLAAALNVVKKSNLKIVLQKNFNSVFKTLAEFILQKSTKNRCNQSKIVVNLLSFLDNCFLNTLCRLWRGFGPHGVIIVARKPRER